MRPRIPSPHQPWRLRRFASADAGGWGWGWGGCGSIKLADTRDRALCDAHAKVFEEEDDPSRRSFFSEIISSIADVKFSLVPPGPAPRWDGGGMIGFGVR